MKFEKDEGVRVRKEGGKNGNRYLSYVSKRKKKHSKKRVH